MNLPVVAWYWLLLTSIILCWLIFTFSWNNALAASAEAFVICVGITNLWRAINK